MEVDVLERVVLGVDGEPVRGSVGKLGHPARKRPGQQHPFVLEPQVPVQVPGVVLVDDEAAAGRGRIAVAILASRLAGSLEVALASVLLELSGHQLRLGQPHTR